MNSKKNKPEKKRADELIEEALRAVEAEDRLAEQKRSPKSQDRIIDLDEEEMEDENEPSQERIAKINPKQLIDKEVYLRLAADFENYRKRAAKDRLEAERSGRERILRGFLEILDNLERGLSQVQSDQSALADGMRIILSQIDTWLRSEGLERIETNQKIFDPTVHEALSQVNSDLPTGIIVQEIKRGYRWPGRLLRPATVVVSKGPLAETTDGEA